MDVTFFAGLGCICWLALGLLHIKIWQWCSFEFEYYGFPGFKAFLFIGGPAGMVLFLAIFLIGLALVGFDWIFGGRIYQFNHWRKA